MMDQDEEKTYSHGCGSPYQCHIAEVMAGYKARSASTGKAQQDFVLEAEGMSKSAAGGLKEKPHARRRKGL